MKRKGKPAPAKAAGKKRPLAAQMKSQPKKPNPFELKGSKGHFDTMGRRSAGKKKNVIEARQEAVNRVRPPAQRLASLLMWWLGNSWCLDGPGDCLRVQGVGPCQGLRSRDIVSACLLRRYPEWSQVTDCAPMDVTQSYRVRFICIVSPVDCCSLPGRLPLHALPVTIFASQRKKTLLVEYRSLRKANTFVDRRFGGEQERVRAPDQGRRRCRVGMTGGAGGDQGSMFMHAEHVAPSGLCACQQARAASPMPSLLPSPGAAACCCHLTQH